MNNLRLFEFAVALGHHRSFARAAESLHVSQPTLSRGIAALEKSLGLRLFDRSTRRVEPTSIGHAFLERAESLLQAAAELEGLAASQDQTLTGQLTIGSGPYPLECSVLAAVARLAELHPKLQLRIIEGPWRDLPMMLHLGSIDLLVLETSIFAGDLRIQVEALPHHPGCLVCRPGHPLLRQRGLAPEDVAKYPFVGIPLLREIRTRTSQSGIFLRVDRETGEMVPSITTTSLYSMRELVQASDGVAAYPLFLARKHARDGRLMVLNINFEMPSTSYGIARSSSRSPSPAAMAFMEVLREIEQKNVDGYEEHSEEAQRRQARRP